MANRRRHDLKYDYHIPGRKRPVAESTIATGHFLALVHEDNPTLTISQLRELITDKTKFILNPEAVAVLDAHIKAHYGDHVPVWRY